MPRKCSVNGCRSGYASLKKRPDEDHEKVKFTVYTFPNDIEECRSWISALPNTDLTTDKITKHIGVCAKHWPPDAPMRRRGRYLCPTVPPSWFFPTIPKPKSKSSLPKNSVTPRSTTKPKAPSVAKAVDIDDNETDAFMEIDNFACSETCDCGEFHSNFLEYLRTKGNVAFNDEQTEYILLSKEREGAVFNYTLIFKIAFSSDGSHVEQVRFEAFCKLKSCTISYGQNGYLWTWSQLTEVLRSISAQVDEPTSDKKMDFILRQVALINAPENNRLYDQNDLFQAFNWYSTSRALYSDLRTYIQLPSEHTLKQITQVSVNTNDNTLYKNFFQSQDERSKNCIVAVDEICIKSSVVNSGGLLFGNSQDVPQKSSRTLLCIMVKCFFTSKKFLIKLIPFHELTPDFQFKCVCDVISLLEGCGATVVAIVNSNNKINQSFFKLFPQWSIDTPYITKSPSSGSPLYLIFDTVRLITNIRNNWLAETTQTLEYPSNGLQNQERRLAKWSDLKELHDVDASKDVRLSPLTQATICPSSVDKQKLSLVLNVFCDSTVDALLRTPVPSTASSWKDTASFISLVLKLWNLFNCKTRVHHIHGQQDSDCIPIDNGDKGQKGLQTLLEWASIASAMCDQENSRQYCFTKDTGFALQWTCVGLAALCQYLLTTDTSAKHHYVCLGFFQQDDIRHHLDHFISRSVGCSYFINVRNVFSTKGLDLDCIKLMLSFPTDNELEDIMLDEIDGHHCLLCDSPTRINHAELFALDEMTNTGMSDSIALDEKMAIFYITSYIASKYSQLSDESQNVPDEIESYFSVINRNGLSRPSEEFLLFTLLSYYYFAHSKDVFCRKKLTSTLSVFPTFFSIDVSVPDRALQGIANILLNDLCKRFTQEAEGQRKQAKLMPTASTSTSLL